MKRRHALVAGIALLATAPCIAQGVDPAPPTRTTEQARTEVQTRQAALRDAERELEAARVAELGTARRDLDDADRTARAARERLAAAQGSSAGGGATQKFGGLEFGVGLSFTADVGTSDRVSDAELVNGIVRVKDENNGIARIMLESHYLFTPNRTSLFGVPAGRWGHGPFVAIQPGTDDIIQAIGAGWMIGFRRPAPATGEDTGQSFNIGFGVVVDPNTRILGDGIVANQPLPAGETAIRYTEEMQIGALLLFSFSF